MDEWVDVPTEPGWYETKQFPHGAGYNPYYVDGKGRVFERSIRGDDYKQEITSELEDFAPFRRVRNIHA